MNAVQPIIDHLRSRGVLPREQLAQLAAAGLLRWDDLADTTNEPQPSFSPAEADELRHRLARRFPEWEPRLEGLCRVAQRLSGSRHWLEASLVLRHAPPHDIYVAVGRGLEQHDPPFDSLWNAIALEEYCDIANEGTPGAGLAAYRTLLALDEQADFGRHNALLRIEEAAAVWNLRQAQRNLLRACEAVLRAKPELIATALRGDQHGRAYWAFVLLYTSRRSQVGECIALEEEHRPPRPFPTGSAWQHAWAQAAVMSPRSTVALLIDRASSDEEGGDLVCPRTWG